MDMDFRQRLEEAREAWPELVGWVEANEALVDRFDPERFHYPDWERVATPEAVEAHFGRQLPHDYYRLLRALSFTHARAAERGVFGGPLSIYPELSAPDRELRRYDNQPPQLYPFAWMGVDGVSYNFVFDGPDYVVAHFQPIDDEVVPWCYPDLAEFLRCKALQSLASARRDPRAIRIVNPSLPTPPEDYGDIFLEVAVLMRAFSLTLTDSDGYALADEATALVRKQVHAGRYPVLSALWDADAEGGELETPGG
jgi:hypothetical protein